MLFYLLNVFLIPKSFQLAFALGRAAEGRRLLSNYASGVGVTLDEIVISKYESSFTKSSTTGRPQSESLYKSGSMRSLTITLIVASLANSIVYFTYLWKPDGVFFSFYNENAFNNLMELLAVVTSFLLCDRIGRRKIVQNTLFFVKASLFEKMPFKRQFLTLSAPGSNGKRG